MHLDLVDRSFQVTAESWLRSLDDVTIADLEMLFRASPGYFPTTLLALRDPELQRRRLIDRTTRVDMRPRLGDGLPVSHPADYDWRFTVETADRLVEDAVAEVLPGSSVLHLGTPSTFTVATRRCPSHRHVLVEGNAAVVEALDGTTGAGTVIGLDLAEQPCPRLGASSAILDPPWYPDYSMLFLIAATDACVVGARLLVCQPSHASRPGVAQERESLLGALPDLGLELVQHATAVVRYEMPHFERMSLRKLLPTVAVPRDWRVGDLLVLRKTGERSMSPSTSLPVERWSEARVGPVRIRLRASGASVDVEPLISRDILDTVSRRDLIRSRIGMWTSGNRVYGIADPVRLHTLLDACHADWTQGSLDAGRTAVHGHRAGVAETVARRLHVILAAELAEHA
jgi:hypothetical protein